jgi:hypothetical protein
MSEVTNESYVPKHTNDDPEHDAGYPPYVVSLEQKRRWDTCEELAEAIFGDLDPGQARAQVWSAVRVYYQSDMPTGDESERLV